MTNIAIFASGEGTNAENIIRHFQGNDSVRVAVVIYNRKAAGVRQRAERLGVPAVYWTKQQLEDRAATLQLLGQYGCQFIVLAGFLLLVPAYLVEAFPERIVNIHPALMPKHCGAGMYGMRVHESVVKSGDRQSGITIHLVDEQFDHGRILRQATCEVLPTDTPDDVAHKVHSLEYACFPETIEQYIKENL
ncbi:MAG: phosphoribosylglycinamide formyltransferase [Bacteroidaceae bacterium]|jgi:phosphoribosylglycinamide formyltransferase-1|nr:phosphoribosylglycinamide formyltransferase [Bacteroidaceae bacterium]MBQ2029534.1 phosphoribosylglycinamide formyltransferase [Bacteroidaceae bacterium]